MLTGLLLTVAAGHADAGTPSVNIRAGAASGSLQSKGTVVAAFPVVNEGERKIDRVRVTSISLTGAARTAPKRLPRSLGSIQSEGNRIVFATFRGDGLRSGKTYVMRVAGTTGKGRARFSLARSVRIPPAAPGKGVARESSVDAQQVEGGKFPPQEPVFPREVNEHPRWIVPTGAFRRPAKRPGATDEAPMAGIQGAQAGSGFRFFTNAPLGIPAGEINEPSGASGGGVVFVTVNYLAAFSTTGGSSFTRLDPTAIFPQNTSVGGFCCDQIVQYVPNIDRFVWLMQQRRGMRIASASPRAIADSGGTAWTYWDIPSAQLGFGDFDFPDLSIGDNALYASTDAGPGLLVMRLPLAQIGAGQTINFQYTNPNHSTVAYFGHLAQNARDEVFWAGHLSSSRMRVFSWRENSGTYFWRDVAIGSWPNNPGSMSSLTPDSRDWLTKLRDNGLLWIGGATRVLTTPQGRPVNQLWFAWSAPRGQGFGQAHVQIVVLDPSNGFRLTSQRQIWNPGYAFAYPALTANSRGEVGLSLEYGGGGNYENHVVGFWGDFVVYTTTASSRGTTRFGDYVTIRPNSADATRFDAFGYGLSSSPSGGAVTDTRYVVFGRP